MRAPRARRSELATPASSERMCEKAPSVGADLVFLDLEDACAPSAKESARGIAVGALTGLDWMVIRVSRDLLRYRRATYVARVEAALRWIIDNTVL